MSIELRHWFKSTGILNTEELSGSAVPLGVLDIEVGSAAMG